MEIGDDPCHPCRAHNYLLCQWHTHQINLSTSQRPSHHLDCIINKKPKTSCHDSHTRYNTIIYHFFPIDSSSLCLYLFHLLLLCRSLLVIQMRLHHQHLGTRSMLDRSHGYYWWRGRASCCCYYIFVIVISGFRGYGFVFFAYIGGLGRGKWMFQGKIGRSSAVYKLVNICSILYKAANSILIGTHLFGFGFAMYFFWWCCLPCFVEGEETPCAWPGNNVREGDTCDGDFVWELELLILFEWLLLDMDLALLSWSWSAELVEVPGIIAASFFMTWVDRVWGFLWLVEGEILV